MNIHQLATEMKGIPPGTQVRVMVEGKVYTDVDIQLVLDNGGFRYVFELVGNKRKPNESTR